MAAAGPLEGKAMKIHSNDFRIADGDKVDLKKWTTNVDPL